MSVAADQLKVSPSALTVIYPTLTDQMQHTALVAAVLGVFIAILGWVLGDWSAARRLRTVVGALNSSARRSLAERGLNTGGFGRWRAGSVLVRAVVVVLAVVWLLLLRPLSFGDLVLVIVVALLVTWMLELLQRRPEEATTAETTERPPPWSTSPCLPRRQPTRLTAALDGRDPASV